MGKYTSYAILSVLLLPLISHTSRASDNDAAPQSTPEPSQDIFNKGEQSTSTSTLETRRPPQKKDIFSQIANDIAQKSQSDEDTVHLIETTYKEPLIEIITKAIMSDANVMNIHKNDYWLLIENKISDFLTLLVQKDASFDAGDQTRGPLIRYLERLHIAGFDKVRREIRGAVALNLTQQALDTYSQSQNIDLREFEKLCHNLLNIPIKIQESSEFVGTKGKAPIKTKEYISLNSHIIFRTLHNAFNALINKKEDPRLFKTIVNIAYDVLNHRLYFENKRQYHQLMSQLAEMSYNAAINNPNTENNPELIDQNSVHLLMELSDENDQFHDKFSALIKEAEDTPSAS